MPALADAAAPPPRRLSASPEFLRTLTVILLLLVAGMGAHVVYTGMTEGYCEIWPGIGTRFTADYSERAFDRIQPGMTSAQVLALIGPPMHIGRGGCAPPGHALWRRGDVSWAYSQDTSDRGGDWAWLSREVVFRDERVVQTVRWVYHD